MTVARKAATALDKLHAAQRDYVIHHGSHNHLLDEYDETAIDGARLDAVIVPTSRPVDCLREAMRLAQSLGCPLIALCSKSAGAASAAKLGEYEHADVTAIHTPPAAGHLPRFTTGAVVRGTKFASTSDLSLKRNLGLLLSRAAGWRRVLFLDDDIAGAQAGGVMAAARLLADYRAVGLKNYGYPDNSVVCHAYREVGYAQDSFIGGGAMLIAPDRTRSFFPDIYNEDWFFLLGDGLPFRAARTGHVEQNRYDPFANPGRARSEEFGDVLAEGLYWLLDERKNLDEADSAFWRDFLHRRQLLLKRVLDKAADTRMAPSLRAAQQSNSYITPKFSLDYIRAWRADLVRWGDFLDTFPAGPAHDLGAGLAALGLTGHAYHSAKPSAGDEVVPAGR